ncbi:MAG: hypothetical protein JO019_04220 [Candidatus Kaiserbacteria bacterium]|nr:hypothetical protein [Candidatus Kaiserbacteria bacterium]
MSTVERREAELDRQMAEEETARMRLLMGLLYCVMRYGHEAVMNVDVTILNIESDTCCKLALVSGRDWSTAAAELEPEQRVLFGFYWDDHVSGKTLTRVAREVVARYQALHR